MFTTEVGEFKGSKTISLFKDGKRVISFGASKAKAIVECVEAIKDFISENKPIATEEKES